MPHSMRDVCFVMFDNETQRKKKYIANIADKTVRNTSKQACIVVGLGGKNTLYNQVARQLMRIYLPFFSSSSH